MGNAAVFADLYRADNDWATMIGKKEAFANLGIMVDLKPETESISAFHHPEQEEQRR